MVQTLRPPSGCLAGAVSKVIWDTEDSTSPPTVSSDPHGQSPWNSSEMHTPRLHSAFHNFKFGNNWPGDLISGLRVRKIFPLSVNLVFPGSMAPDMSSPSSMGRVRPPESICSSLAQPACGLLTGQPTLGLGLALLRDVGSRSWRTRSHPQCVLA